MNNNPPPPYFVVLYAIGVYLSRKKVKPEEIAEIQSGVIYADSRGSFAVCPHMSDPDNAYAEIEVNMGGNTMVYETQGSDDALTGFQQDLDHLMSLWKQNNIAELERIICAN